MPFQMKLIIFWRHQSLGSLTHWLKNTLDYKMGLMIIIGGVIGTLGGIATFKFFNDIGKLSLIISLSYMYL